MNWETFRREALGAGGSCSVCEEAAGKGAVNVLVSMAGKGAVLLAEDGSVYAAEAPKGTLKMVSEPEIRW